MKLTQSLALALAAAVTLSACKKEHTTMATPCATTIFCVSNIPTGHAGTFTPSTVAFSSIATINSSLGAYNSADDCYYVITDSIVDSTTSHYNIINKISSAGTINRYRCTDTNASFSFSSIAYNAYSNVLVAIRNGDELVSISLGASTYSCTPLATYPINSDIAVDPSTGNIYSTGYNPFTGDYTVIKYVTGAVSFTPIESGSSAMLAGLKFNSSDNMLYAIRNNHGTTPSSEFIKINPAGGTTVLTALPFTSSNYFSSVCLDGCNEKYIIAALEHSVSGPDSTTIYQYNMTGGLIQQNRVYGNYYGFDVKY